MRQSAIFIGILKAVTQEIGLALTVFSQIGDRLAASHINVRLMIFLSP